MSKLKKILIMCAAYVLVAALAIGGTVAYLTSEDSDVNVMTLGNVKIEQIEQEWNADQTALQEFTQDKPLYPYVGELGWENVPTTYDANPVNNPAYRRFTMENVVDKYVSVKNTGKSPAFVRTFIALEMGEYTTLNEFFGAGVGLSNNAADGNEFKFPGAWVWEDDYVAKIGEKNYNIMVAVHTAPLQPKETTIPSLLQVYLSCDATNETVEKLDGNGNGTYDILVLSQAVQVEGFKDAETALNTAFGDPENGYHPWTGENTPVIPVVIDNEKDLAEALADGEKAILLQNGEYNLAPGSISAGTSITGNGQNVVVKIPAAENENTSSVMLGDNVVLKGLKIMDDGSSYGHGGAGLVLVNGKNVVIEDCEFDITGTNAIAIAMGGNSENATVKGCEFTGGYKHIGPAPGTPKGIVIDGCTFNGVNGTYAIHLNATAHDTVIKNSKISLFNTFFGFGNDAGKLIFENCDFGFTSGAVNVVKLYRDADFVNCDFEEGFRFSDANKATTVTFVGGSWGDGTIKDHFMKDSFAYDMHATFDGEEWYWNATAREWTKQ